MKKFIIISALALMSFSLPLSATVIQFSTASAASSRQAVLADGATLVSDANYEILAGTFSNPNNFSFNSSLSVQQNFTNMEAAGDGGFSQFGLVQPGNGASEVTGSLILTTTGVFPHSQVGNGTPSLSDENSSASFFDGKQIYLVIVNGTTLTAATQMGIFTSTSWVITHDNDGTGATDVNTFTTSTTDSMSALGNAGQVNASPSQLELAATVATPEPTTMTALLGAGGMLGLLRRRRTA